MNHDDARELIEQAIQTMHRAYAPYSHFHVGAAVRTADGKTYTGCNVENISYGLTICAERVATGCAIASGARKIQAVAIVCDQDISPTPCGACRQVLAEFASENCPVYVASARRPADYQTYLLGDLLPASFKM